MGERKVVNYHLDDIEDEFMAFSKGKEVLEVVRPHIPELAEMVNYDREITVLWHRNKGPAFVGYIIKSWFDENVVVPTEIEGVTLQTMIRRMADATSVKGSKPLKKFIAEHIVLILTKSKEFNGLRQLHDELKSAG